MFERKPMLKWYKSLVVEWKPKKKTREWMKAQYNMESSPQITMIICENTTILVKGRTIVYCHSFFVLKELRHIKLQCKKKIAFLS